MMIFAAAATLPDTQLWDYFEQTYRPAIFRARLQSKTRYAVRLAVERFREFTRPTITIAEISSELLDGFASSVFGSSRETKHPLGDLVRKMLSYADPERFPSTISRPRARAKDIAATPVASSGPVPTIEHDLTLLATLEILYLRDNPKPRRETAKHRTSIRYLRWFLSREPKLSDLSFATMLEFYRFCFRRGLSVSTVRDHRSRLTTLLRYATKAKLLDCCPELPAVIKAPQRNEAIATQPMPKPNTLWHFFEHTVWPTRLSKCSGETRKDYERAIREFLIFCGDSNVMVEQVTEQRIAEFRQHMEARAKRSNHKGKNKGVAYQHSMRMRFILRCTEPEKFPKLHGHNRAIEPADGGGSLRKHMQTYLSERDVSKGYRDQMRWIVNQFGQWLGREPELTDLNKESVNSWLDSLIAQNISRQTINNRRRMLLTLWRDAFEVELLDQLPRRIKKIRVARIIPRA